MPSIGKLKIIEELSIEELFHVLATIEYYLAWIPFKFRQVKVPISLAQMC